MRRSSGAAIALGLVLAMAQAQLAYAQGKVTLILDLNAEESVQYLAEGTERAIVPDITPEVDAHGFVGWNTEPDGSGEELAPGDEVLESTTLYAQWEDDVSAAETVSLLGAVDEGMGSDGAAAGEPVVTTATDEDGTEWSVVSTGEGAREPSSSPVPKVTDEDGTEWSVIKTTLDESQGPEVNGDGTDQLPNTAQAPAATTLLSGGSAIALCCFLACRLRRAPAQDALS